MAKTATLVAHCGGEIVTRADLRALPKATALSKSHKPLQHIDLVEALEVELQKIGLTIKREQLAIANEGMRLFGTMDLEAVEESSATALIPRDATDRGLAIGFRHGNDKSFATSGVAGNRIFVCDNLAMYGQYVAFHKKHTTRVIIRDVVANGCDKLVAQFGDLNKQIERLQNTNLSDGDAKAFLIDAFTGEESPMAIKYLPPVWQYYRDAGRDGGTIVMEEKDGVMVPTRVELPDCAPRTLYGLNNAFTRVVQTLTSAAHRHATGVEVGRLFGLRDETKEEYVRVTD